MCSSPKAAKIPKPVAVVKQAKPAVINSTNTDGSNSAQIEIAANTAASNANRRRRGKKAFKQTDNVSGVNTPGAAGGLSIPKANT